MKTLITLFLLAALSFKAFAQDQTYKNEFGIDATSFFLRFLKIDINTPTVYLPTYYLTYRRKFENGNLRFGIGGYYANADVPPVFNDDHNSYKFESKILSTRIGWEFKNELSKKWQVFYGCDFRPSFQHTIEDAIFWNGGYAYGAEYKIENYALAPLVGFRFRLNERLSLSTETSLAINFQEEKFRNYYTPVTSDYEPKADEVQPTVQRVFTSFSQPIILYITFDI